MGRTGRKRIDARPFIAVAVATLMTVSAWTEGRDGAEDGGKYSFSGGFLINEYVDDFGLGVQVGMPHAWERLSGRITGTVQFSRAADWEPWGTLQIGLVGTQPVVNEFARFYGEGGVVMAFPGGPNTKKLGVGGYGLFGFEFFTGIDSPVSYFVELGASGCGLEADMADGAFMLNGFRVQAGFRGYPFRKE